MKLNVFLALLLTVLTVKLTQVYSLECYYCEDASCDDLDDSKLGYCGPVTIDTTEGTTVSEASTTVDGSTDDTQTPGDTTPDPTLADTTTTLADTTTTPADTTTTSAETTTTADTTTAPVETTTIQADSTTTSVDTTTAPVDTTLGETTTTPPDTTAPSAETTIIESNVNAVAEAALNPMIIRKRNAPNAADLLIRNYRAISRRRRDTSEGLSYACYSIDVITDGISRVKRGCVVIPTEASGCEVVRVENSIPEGVDDNCYICLRDGCNGGSAAIQVSIALILSLLLSKLFI